MRAVDPPPVLLPIIVEYVDISLCYVRPQPTCYESDCADLTVCRISGDMLPYL